MEQLHKTKIIESLCELLRITTHKRIVSTDTRTGKEIIEQIESGTYFKQGDIKVEYYNTIFTKKEVCILKSKLIKLIESI